jgi:hypothetical protein
MIDFNFDFDSEWMDIDNLSCDNEDDDVTIVYDDESNFEELIDFYKNKYGVRRIAQ